MAQTDFAQAIRLAVQGYEKNPQNLQNAFNLALYYLASGKEDEAESIYHRSLDDIASPHKVHIHNAIRDLNGFLNLSPNHPQAQTIRNKLEKYARDIKRGAE